MNKQIRHHRSDRGFTLVELLIAVVIVGIVSAFAYPSVLNSIRKARRSEAISVLGQLQLAQERYRANKPTYASNLSDLPGGIPQTTANGYYSIAIVSGSVSSSAYAATATAVSGTSQANDSKCVSFTVSMSQGTALFSSTDNNNAVDINNQNHCWPK